MTHFPAGSDAQCIVLDKAGVVLFPAGFKEARESDAVLGGACGFCALPFEDATLAWDSDAGDSGSFERVDREAGLPFPEDAGGNAPGGRTCFSLLFGTLAGVPGFKFCF